MKLVEEDLRSNIRRLAKAIRHAPLLRRADWLWNLVRRPYRTIVDAGAEGRDEFLRLFPKGGVCAEIGVWKGDFSSIILKIKRPSELHLVDPWTFMPQFPYRWHGGLGAKSQTEMNDIANRVRTRFSTNCRVQIHRATSTEFLTSTIRRLDWVYIDGDHAFPAVYSDLKLAWPLVAPGGYMCGDDYHDDDYRFGVKKAVTLFAAEVGLEPVIWQTQFYFKKTA
jgi:hypothetical protein